MAQPIPLPAQAEATTASIFTPSLPSAFEFQEYLKKFVDWAVASGPRILLIVGLTAGALYVSHFVSDHIFRLVMSRQQGERKKRAETLSSVVRWISNVVIVTVAIMMVLGELGIDIGPMIAAAGVLGLAVGFGAQNLVQDVISGFFILLEDQIRVGDVVEVSGKAGGVEKVNLRHVILRDLSGNVHYIRNGNIDVITNMTKEFSYAVHEIGIAYREDVDEVIEVVKGVHEQLMALPALKDDILAPLEILGLDQLGDSTVVIKARSKTRPSRQWAAKREFNRLMKKEFDARGIEIPFPHMTLYMGEPKQGPAPPLNVALSGEIAPGGAPGEPAER